MALAALAGGCSAGQPAASARRPASTTSPAPGGPLVAPKTSATEDAGYFQDLAKVDPSLATYVNARQDVALQALLTDGSAFCAFLKRGGGVDDAMESVVIGADSVEQKTHLPAGVATFNAIDAVALIDLCPGEQHLLPAADRAHIESLRRSLDG